MLGFGDSGGAVDGDGASGGESGLMGCETGFGLKNESNINYLPPLYRCRTISSLNVRRCS